MARANGRLLSPELFVDLVEYVKVLQRGSNIEDNVLTEDHPLVAFCHDMLEQLSAAVLFKPIVGFGESSRRRLALERRRLERSKNRNADLQRVLFELESVGSVIGPASYTRSEDATHEFLETEFLSLLRALVQYLRDVRPQGEETAAAESALIELESVVEGDVAR